MKRVLRILFHSVKQNDICLMVSDTKLCNNVAKYGTKQFLVLHKKMQTFFLEKNLRQPSFVLKVSLAKNDSGRKEDTHNE